MSVNFPQRHPAKPTEEIEPPTVKSPLLPKEEEKTKGKNTVEPIQVNDAQYDLLTRALCPEVAPGLKDLKIDVPKLKAPGFVGGAGQPPHANPRAVSPDQQQGAPII